MNKKIVVLTFFIILGMVVCPTIYKIYQTHQANLKIVIEKEFYYQAKLCYKNDLCENVVTLENLYTNNYLKERIADPTTKKYYDNSSYVNIETKEINLIP